VKVVSEMLGHADVSITLRVYAHILPHMQHQAVEAMDATLAPQGGSALRVVDSLQGSSVDDIRLDQNRGQTDCYSKSGSSPRWLGPLHFWICRGRWDRNRTCNLRFWSPIQVVSHSAALFVGASSFNGLPTALFVSIR